VQAVQALALKPATVCKTITAVASNARGKGSKQASSTVTVTPAEVKVVVVQESSANCTRCLKGLPKSCFTTSQLKKTVHKCIEYTKVMEPTIKFTTSKVVLESAPVPQVPVPVSEKVSEKVGQAAKAVLNPRERESYRKQVTPVIVEDETLDVATMEGQLKPTEQYPENHLWSNILVKLNTFPIDLDESKVVQLFSAFGVVSSVFIPRNPDMQPKGVLFVDYFDFNNQLAAHKSALSAIFALCDKSAASGYKYLDVLYCQQYLSKERRRQCQDINRSASTASKQFQSNGVVNGVVHGVVVSLNSNAEVSRLVSTEPAAEPTLAPALASVTLGKWDTILTRKDLEPLISFGDFDEEPIPTVLTVDQSVKVGVSEQARSTIIAKAGVVKVVSTKAVSLKKLRVEKAKTKGMSEAS